MVGITTISVLKTLSDFPEPKVPQLINGGAEIPTIHFASKISVHTTLNYFPVFWPIWCRNDLIFCRLGTPNLLDLQLFSIRNILIFHIFVFLAILLAPTSLPPRFELDNTQILINLLPAFYFFHCPFLFLWLSMVTM